jgi:hypothetical protein
MLIYPMEKKRLGTNVYWYGSHVVTQETVYEGDTDAEVKERARKFLAQFEPEKLVLLSCTRVKFYPLGK